MFKWLDSFEWYVINVVLVFVGIIATIYAVWNFFNYEEWKAKIGMFAFIILSVNVIVANWPERK